MVKTKKVEQEKHERLNLALHVRFVDGFLKGWNDFRDLYGLRQSYAVRRALTEFMENFEKKAR